MIKKQLQSKTQKISIDKLAQITANGFAELRSEFKGDINGLEDKINRAVIALGKKPLGSEAPLGVFLAAGAVITLF